MNNKTISDMKQILYQFGLLVLALSAQAASFDCRKAKSKTEKFSCEDDKLSKLNDSLSKACKQVLDRSDDKQKLPANLEPSYANS